MLVLSVIYIPQKSVTFICLNTTPSEALFKFACNRVSFEDFSVFDIEIQKEELKELKKLVLIFTWLYVQALILPHSLPFCHGHSAL